ncbi:MULTISPECIES: hypothetical protein [Mesorhizobium]|uniref:hypothetical protein n=1 Tax=Mesorhizobium TaxID=68287 RepID=UPI000301FB3B|nr:MULTISPECIES: hypothetical protein [Mesorhizobium]MDF3151444.1 hypothetical protein [Mesorhizobium sp. XAP10]MDF3244330.1 hypothetical protein [Mesorhizobium sp. XAP4]
MAFAQNNLGDVSWNRASYGGGKAEYQKAIGFFENAKQRFTEAGYTSHPSHRPEGRSGEEADGEEVGLRFPPTAPCLSAGFTVPICPATGTPCREPQKDSG